MNMTSFFLVAASFTVIFLVLAVFGLSGGAGRLCKMRGSRYLC